MLGEGEESESGWLVASELAWVPELQAALESAWGRLEPLIRRLVPWRPRGKAHSGAMTLN